MSLRPLGDRVLIEPREAPKVTDSGIHITCKYKEPEMLGTVVTIGDMRDPWCKCGLAGTCLGCLIKQTIREKFGHEGVRYLLRQVRKPRGFEEGDTVVFAVTSGQEVWVDGKLYLTMKEADVLAKVEA